LKLSVKILLAVLVLLVVARLLLPYFVVRYVNRVLADMGSYTGRIEDVNIALLRGAYQIQDLNIRKVNGKIKKPFLHIPTTDLSIEWASLFKGSLVGEVETYRPQLNFAFSEEETRSQTGADVDWTKLVKDLMPIQINRFAVFDGEINLINVFSTVKADLSLKNFQGEIRNIRNVEELGTRLPSPVRASGDVPGYGGTMGFKADMNLLKQMPDFSYQLRFDEVSLPKINTIAKEFSGVDFEQGTISVYSEMAMYNGRLVGYLKPLTKDMKIFKLKEGDNRTVGQFFKEVLAEAGTQVLKNQKRDQVATKIPLSGTVEEVKTDFWPILFGVLRNAYVEAFRKEFDNTVSFQDALKGLKEDYKERRAERKAERKERREERKEARRKRREERKKE